VSYTVYPYLVDLEHLRALHGSKDEVLLQSLEAAFADRFADDEGNSTILNYDGRYGEGTWVRVSNEELEPDLPRLRKALHELLYGEETEAEDGIKHIEALQLLCEHTGIALPHDEFIGLNSGCFRAFEHIADLHKLIEDFDPPIPLLPTWGVAAISCLTAKEAADRLSQFVVATLPADQAEPKWITAAQEQYRNWLHEVVVSERDLITFLL
jgi:hypothetical protein